MSPAVKYSGCPPLAKRRILLPVSAICRRNSVADRVPLGVPRFSWFRMFVPTRRTSSCISAARFDRAAPALPDCRSSLRSIPRRSATAAHAAASAHHHRHRRLVPLRLLLRPDANHLAQAAYSRSHWSGRAKRRTAQSSRLPRRAQSAFRPPDSPFHTAPDRSSPTAC